MVDEFRVGGEDAVSFDIEASPELRGVGALRCIHLSMMLPIERIQLAESALPLGALVRDVVEQEGAPECVGVAGP